MNWTFFLKQESDNPKKKLSKKNSTHFSQKGKKNIKIKQLINL